MATISLCRCLCIHSMSQVVDIVVQSLMYQRNIIPEPISHLMQLDPDSKFVQQYNKICNSLRLVFKACNVRVLREVVVILGPTPYLAREIYRIPVHFCEEHTGSLDQGCGPACQVLEPAEMRTVWMALQNMFSSQEAPQAPDLRMFVFARVSEPLLNAAEAEDVEEDDSFELPDAELAVKRRVVENEIHVKRCREVPSPLSAEEDTDASDCSVWLRIVPFVTSTA